MDGGTKNLMTEWLCLFEEVATKTSTKSGIVNLQHWTRLHHLETMLGNVSKSCWQRGLATNRGGAFCWWFSRSCFSFTAIRPFNHTNLPVHSLIIPIPFLNCLHLYISIIIPQLTLTVAARSICIPKLHYHKESKLKEYKFSELTRLFWTGKSYNKTYA